MRPWRRSSVWDVACLWRPSSFPPSPRPSGRPAPLSQRAWHWRIVAALPSAARRMAAGGGCARPRRGPCKLPSVCLCPPGAASSLWSAPPVLAAPPCRRYATMPLLHRGREGEERGGGLRPEGHSHRGRHARPAPSGGGFCGRSGEDEESRRKGGGVFFFLLQVITTLPLAGVREWRHGGSGVAPPGGAGCLWRAAVQVRRGGGCAPPRPPVSRPYPNGGSCRVLRRRGGRRPPTTVPRGRHPRPRHRPRGPGCARGRRCTPSDAPPSSRAAFLFLDLGCAPCGCSSSIPTGSPGGGTPSTALDGGGNLPRATTSIATSTAAGQDRPPDDVSVLGQLDDRLHTHEPFAE